MIMGVGPITIPEPVSSSISLVAYRLSIIDIMNVYMLSIRLRPLNKQLNYHPVAKYCCYSRVSLDDHSPQGRDFKGLSLL